MVHRMKALKEEIIGRPKRRWEDKMDFNLIRQIEFSGRDADHSPPSSTEVENE
jgi:hypothetical protein